MPTPLINSEISLQWLVTHATGVNVDVAVIDSGIDASHPALRGKIRGACEVSKNPKGCILTRKMNGGKSTDPFGHGTAVAGIIADIAPQARIVSVKVLDDYNSCTGDILIAGLKWALDQKIRLINMSLCTSKPAWMTPLNELCERAFFQNSIIVAARRNFGDLGCPAMFSSVISVDREDYAEKLRVHYRPGDAIQFDARGTQIEVLAPGGGRAIRTGTSFATPHVCGFIALLLELFPDITASEAKSALKAFSDQTRRSENTRFSSSARNRIQVQNADARTSI